MTFHPKRQVLANLPVTMIVDKNENSALMVNIAISSDRKLEKRNLRGIQWDERGRADSRK